MLTLLARLGLRAGEVAALALDDIDWRAGEITVRGKGSRAERLPATSRRRRGDRRLPARCPARAVRGRPAGVSARPGAAPGPDRRWVVSGAVGAAGQRTGSARFTPTGCGTRRPPACCRRAPR